MPGVADYQRAYDLRLTLGELPEAMQQRRHYILSGSSAAQAQLRQLVLDTLSDMSIESTGDAQVLELSNRLVSALQRDDLMLLDFRPAVQRYIAGLPWYYQASMLYSYDSMATGSSAGRSVFLLGCLAFSALLMIRWPGIGIIARGGAIGLGQFVVRIGLVMAVVLAAFAGNSPRTETKAGQAAVVLVVLMITALIYWLTWKASQYWRLPRQYSPFLAMRLLQRKRIAFFSLGAVTLCVAMVLIVISVMGGFLDMVKDRSHHLMGDLVMDGDSTQGFPYYQQFIDQIKTWPQIEAATPIIQSFGLLQLPNAVTPRTKPVHVMGMRLDEADAVNNFKTNLYYEEWYPGSTTLKEQAQPFCGITPLPKGTPTLPAELEASLQKSPAWKKLQEDPSKALRYTRMPYRAFPGPGVYEFNPNADDSDAQWALRPAWGEKRLPGIIIGRDLIAQRTESGEYQRSQQYPRGSQVILTLAPMTPAGRLSQSTAPINKPLHYADDSRTGVYEVDSMYVYVDFDMLQQLLNMAGGQRASLPEGSGGEADVPRISSSTQPRTSQIQIRLRSGADIQQVKAKVDAAWRQLAASVQDDTDHTLMSWVLTQTWEEMQWTFISAVEKEKVLMLILFGVISMVAIFLILCIFYMIVAEKTRDIGIIKSVGGSSGGVAAVFLSYGAAIGVVGAMCGLTLGVVFVHYINQIQDWLATLHPELRVWKADVYSFDTIPNVVKVEDALVIGVIAIFASIVGALVPALIAARKHPVESLRYE